MLFKLPDKPGAVVPPSSAEKYKRRLLEATATAKTAKITFLEQQLARLKADLCVEKRSRSKAVSVQSELC